jgi:regulator of replication initiation timing
VSKIHSLVLHVEQLLKQHQLLQQENQALRAQIAEQEEKLASLDASQNQQGYSAADEATMQRLIDLVDNNLHVDEASTDEQ